MNGLGMEHYEDKLSVELEKNNVGFVHLSEKLENLIKLQEEKYTKKEQSSTE
jgi:ABC-type Zn uptake system ZnuABC Zn-binding protein ZnuA